MIEYTKEEYKLLHNLLREEQSGFVKVILQAAQEKTPIKFYAYWSEKVSVYDTIRQCLQKEYPYQNALLFKVPFEDLPLRINEPGKISRGIVKWRFQIGK